MQASDNGRLDQDNRDGGGVYIIDGSLILHSSYDGKIGHLMSDNIMNLHSKVYQTCVLLVDFLLKRLLCTFEAPY